MCIVPSPDCEKAVQSCAACGIIQGHMGWTPGKSYYEGVVENALKQLSARFPLCSDYRHNRSTWFSGRLRYDFILGTSMRNSVTDPYHLIEVHGEQHYLWNYDKTNDLEKERLAHQWWCPLLVIPYTEAPYVSSDLLTLISAFVQDRKALRTATETWTPALQ